jgi:hypothetical protein
LKILRDWIDEDSASKCPEVSGVLLGQSTKEEALSLLYNYSFKLAVEFENPRFILTMLGLIRLGI